MSFFFIFVYLMFKFVVPGNVLYLSIRWHIRCKQMWIGLWKLLGNIWGFSIMKIQMMNINYSQEAPHRRWYICHRAAFMDIVLCINPVFSWCVPCQYKYLCQKILKIKLFLGHGIITVKPNTASMKLVFTLVYHACVHSELYFLIIFLVVFTIFTSEKMVSTQFGTDVQWFKDGPKSYA